MWQKLAFQTSSQMQKSLQYFTHFTSLIQSEQKHGVCPHMGCTNTPPPPVLLPHFFSPYIFLTLHLSIFPIPVRQMPLRNFRAVEWKWWKPQAGSHCKTPAPRLPAQTPSFRSTSWNWGCFLIKALVDWARLSRGCKGNFKVALDRYI